MYIKNIHDSGLNSVYSGLFYPYSLLEVTRSVDIIVNFYIQYFLEIFSVLSFILKIHNYILYLLIIYINNICNRIIMKYSNKPFSMALKDIMNKKDVVHRKLAAKTNFCFSYFCVLKKRKKAPPIETIVKIANGLEIPPEYFLEYRIDKIVKQLYKKPDIIDDVFEYTSRLTGDNVLKVAEKETEYGANSPDKAKILLKRPS